MYMERGVDQMILKSFDAFKKIFYNEFLPEDFIGVVTKERMDHIISAIRSEEYVNEIFCVNNLKIEKDENSWYGLKVEWSNTDRAGILTVKYKKGIDWYKFNLGSLRLNNLYELVPDMDESDEEKLRAVDEEEGLNSLMKWKR